MDMCTHKNSTCEARPTLLDSWSNQLVLLLKTAAWLFRAVIFHTVEAILAALGYTEDGPERERARNFILVVFLFGLVAFTLYSFCQWLRKFSVSRYGPSRFYGHVCGPLQTQTKLVCTTCGRDCDAKTALIIDTDCGIDGALAIMLAMEITDCHLVAITCTHGVASLENTWQNIFRVLAMYEGRKVPVFAGCHESILGYNKFNLDYHGQDGFGNIATSLPPISRKKIEEENAISALIRLSIEYSGNLNLLCLGPLSNIALAQRLDPSFSSRLRSLIVLGGNYHDHPIVADHIPEGPRNLDGISEFNFECDPEAATIIVGEFICPIICIPWETCYSCTFPWSAVDSIIRCNTNRANFVNNITKHVRELENSPGLCPNAFLAVAAMIDPRLGNRSRRKLTAVMVRSTISVCETAAQRRHRLHGAPDIDIVSKIDKDKALQLFKSIVK